MKNNKIKVTSESQYVLYVDNATYNVNAIKP